MCGKCPNVDRAVVITSAQESLKNLNYQNSTVEFGGLLMIYKGLCHPDSGYLTAASPPILKAASVKKHDAQL
jgi:hypothetical protein